MHGLINRNQTLIVKAYDRVKTELPIPFRGLDTDNDSAFMNDTVVEFCKDSDIDFTRSRLYINFFQPSFKLKSKTREGSKVIKLYHKPMTPCDRVLASPHIAQAAKDKLRKQRDLLDPVQLLHDIRSIQQRIAELSSHSDISATTPGPDVNDFLKGLSTAWKSGETRPTHRKPATGKRTWRTRTDPFEQAWPLVCE